MAVSADSITASVPSNTALATSDTSALVGVGAVIMLSSIWVAVITGTPADTHDRTMAFWRWGTSSIGQEIPRSPRATMTASARSRMAGNAADRRWRLDLGDEPRTSRSGRLPDPLQIAGRADERDRQIVDLRTFQSSRQLEIMIRRAGEADALIGQVDTRLPLGPATGDDLGVDPVAVHAGHGQHDGAVAEHDPIAVPDVLDQLRIFDRHPLTARGTATRHQPQRRSLHEERPSVGERTGPDLGPGEIGEDRHRSTGGGGAGPDHLQTGEVFGQLAVAQVEAEHVDPRRQQSVDLVRSFGRGPERGHDLRTPAHACCLARDTRTRRPCVRGRWGPTNAWRAAMNCRRQPWRGLPAFVADVAVINTTKAAMNVSHPVRPAWPAHRSATEALPSEASRSQPKRSGGWRRRDRRAKRVGAGQSAAESGDEEDTCHTRCVRLGRRTAARTEALPSEASRSRPKAKRRTGDEES